MRRLLLALLLAAAPVSAQSAATPTVAAASWLAGCWELRTASRVTQEQWMAPLGGAMLGMSRTVVRDTVRDWEYVYLGPRDGAFAYVVQPARQELAVFPSTHASDSLLVFENLTHDFPQRILYRRRGADSVAARIEGQIDGQARAVDFPMRRVTCP